MEYRGCIREANLIKKPGIAVFNILILALL
jgi:hypothetical protein